MSQRPAPVYLSMATAVGHRPEPPRLDITPGRARFVSSTFMGGGKRRARLPRAPWWLVALLVAIAGGAGYLWGAM